VKSGRLPGYVGITRGREHTMLTLEEWLGGTKPHRRDKVVYLPTLHQMLAWSDRVQHRIAPKPKPDEAQIARIAEMLTKNDCP
jgi:hypothetical protein